jgi:hypothetical protein
MSAHARRPVTVVNQTMPTVNLMTAALMHEGMPQDCQVMVRLSVSGVVGERAVKVKFILAKG